MSIPTRTKIVTTPFRGRPTKFKAIHILAVMLDHPEGVWGPKMRHLVNGSSKKNQHFKSVVEEMRKAGVIYVDSVYKGLPIFKIQTKRGGSMDQVEVKARNAPSKIGGSQKFYVKLNGVLMTAGEACEKSDVKVATFYNILSRMRFRQEAAEADLPQRAFDHLLALKSSNKLRGSRLLSAKQEQTASREVSNSVFLGVNSIFSLGSRM